MFPLANRTGICFWTGYCMHEFQAFKSGSCLHLVRWYKKDLRNPSESQCLMAPSSPLFPSSFRVSFGDPTPSSLSPASNELYRLPLELDLNAEFNKTRPPTPESPTLAMQKRRSRHLRQTNSHVSLQRAIEAVFQFDGRTDRYKPWYWYDSLMLRVP